MTIEEEIAEAQSYTSDPPKNESNTCEWIILPLLWSAGYARRDIESRMADNTGQFPDYTLLPNDASLSWYLEAKSWNVSLEDIHAKQALNYANHNGKRFVVLTNGQNWRLYDNAIQGLLADKLVVHASLRDTTRFTDFLTMLSKTEVLSGSLERLVSEIRERQKREVLEQRERQRHAEEEQRTRNRQMELRTLLRAVLPDQLNDPNTELVSLITQNLNDKAEFKDLTSETLSLWFDELLSQTPNDWKGAPANPVPMQIDRPSFSERRGERILTLKALQGVSIDGQNTKPIAIHTPDGMNISISSWVGLAAQAVRWLLQQSRPVPVPFESSHRTRWFLNSSAVHKREEIRRKFKSISANGKTVYMDADRSGEMFLHDIYALCQAMQIAPEEFRITIAG